MNIPLYVGVMAVLVLMSAYFSATETAFTSLSKTKLKLMTESNPRAQLALDLAERYDELVSTILIGNNIVNISLSSLGTLLFVGLIGDLGATVSTVVITIVVLIFGEVCPKGIAKDMPEKFAIFSAPFIRVVLFVFTPFNHCFKALKRLMSKLFHSDGDDKMSSEELLMIVDEAQQEGGIDKDESILLHNVIEFSDLKAEDVLTHRIDLEAVPLDMDKHEISRIFSESKYSRLLVYEESIDNIVGVLHQKDFYDEDGITSKAVNELMTTPIFILPTEKIDDVLRKLQKKKSHIAVVLDEYGGTTGIVTMEDILEELVGEIWDEHDEVIADYKKLSNDTYLVNCTMNLDDFMRKFEIDDDDYESVSLGGWIAEQLGSLPEEGETLEYGYLLITVKAIENRRITQVEVKINKDEELSFLAQGTEI
ncbi:MAG: HlyC/CorC family transporter [Clostridia bacterium]|nr:HlyC/CorC family transporter [Clostridia bacterium]